MPNEAKDKPAAVDVPSAVELAKKKKAEMLKGKAKEKKNALPFLAVGAVILVAIIVFAALFLVPKYKYSFNINGVDFVSNEYTPSEFFPQFRDNNSFLVVVDLKEGQSNAWTVNAMNLWLVALNADHKRVQSLVQLMDSSGAVKSCTTNDSNLLVSRDVPLLECGSLLSDASRAKVLIGISNQNTAVLTKSTVQIIASGDNTVSQANYFVIEQMYPDFNRTLAIVNERINSVKK